MTSFDRLKGKRILVVEDEFLLADDLTRALVAAGAEVFGPAPSVPAAERLIKEAGRLDAAVLDINLREVLSYPVADILLGRAIPFLFTTGYDNILIPEQYRDIPRVRKPYDRHEVLDHLTELL